MAVTVAADQDHHKAVKVTRLSRRDIIEKLDGKAATATVVEVTFDPRQKDSPHHNAGTRTRLLAVIPHSRDTNETTVPEKGKEWGSRLVTVRLHFEPPQSCP